MSGYVARLQQEISGAEGFAAGIGAKFNRSVDSIYLGGGTPSTLDPDQLAGIFNTLHSEFDVSKDAEVTVECAPGTIRPEILDVLLEAGANRVSLGAQSFVDQEIRSVGRQHTTEQAIMDVSRLFKNGLTNINVDLIAGLPHQNRESWLVSLEKLAELQAPHASIYILEIDDDSRLGRELIAGGSRYHAHHVPDSDLNADLYLEAIDCLQQAGLQQYEISNFARAGKESKHNLKYWTRQPYLGFGLDAHSFLAAKDPSSDCESIRFYNTDALETYIGGPPPASVERVDRQRAIEEWLFLGLRLNTGVDLSTFGADVVEVLGSEFRELAALGLLESDNKRWRLTARGRLLSNEVFERFIGIEQIV